MGTNTGASEIHRRSRGNILVISGVNISRAIPAPGSAHPKKDYEVLFQEIQPDIIDLENIRTNKKWYVKVGCRLLGAPWGVALAALPEANQYEAVVATGEDVGFPIAWLFRLFHVGTPLIVTCHNISSRRPGFFLKYLNVAKSISLFQCLAKSQAKMLLQYPNVGKEKIRLLSWHVDHHFFSPRPDVPLKNQICSAGMASRDYATLVAAAAGLHVDVKIAADSPWFRQELNISREKIPANVEVRSYGTYEALRRLYAESLLVVVPLCDVPYSAGYTVILEAMSMGKAVIVTRIKQKDDFISDGWNGLYVNPGDAADLREKICFLLERPEEALRLGANARKTVEECFTLQHYAERMSADLLSVTGETNETEYRHPNL